jgi:hypothetical protein
MENRVGSSFLVYCAETILKVRRADAGIQIGTESPVNIPPLPVSVELKINAALLAFQGRG